MSDRTVRTEIENEINRCRKLVDVYKKRGALGSLGTVLIQSSIEKGEAAIISGKDVDLNGALGALKGCR